MPNHVINEAIFRDLNVAQIATIRTMVRNSTGEIDFNILVPMPLNIWMGDVGSKHEKAFKRTALDWCRENWGTKWNAYGIDEGGKYKSFVETDDSVTLTFQTAWRAPYPWLAALFNFTKMTFDHNWLDEGHSRGVAGKFNYAALEDWRSGDGWTESEADDDLQKHLHKLLFGAEAFTDEPDDEAVA